MITRREIVRSGFCALASTVAPSSLRAKSTGKRVLVLGGTDFLGPSIVTQLLSAGDDVTLFNRGRTNPSLFPQLEKIRGNRSARKSDEDLSGLSRGRWDLVIDVWPNDPSIVESAARLLAPRVSHYLYVSSVAAYDGYPKANMDETSPLRPWTEATRDYDHNKAESERRLGVIVGNKLLIVRPGPIKGRRDDNPMDLVTWLLRARNQGTHIAPGDKDQAVQIVDVEDVASFLNIAIRRRYSGTFNLTGKPQSFASFIEQCKLVTKSQAEFIWIPRSFLEAQGLKTDHELKTFCGNFPLWRPDADVQNIFRISSAKAYAAGWKTRPFADTACDSLATFEQSKTLQNTWKDFLTPEREQEVLAAWRQS